MPPSRPIPLEGVLNCWTGDYDLPDILLAISRSGKTGRLQFSNAEGEKTIYVKEGRFIFAESSSEDDGLGPYLLRSGTIKLPDFTRVSKLVEAGKRLGALLVAEGVLEPKELVPAVVGQVRAIILSLFRRTESWYGFKEETLSPKESITLNLPVAELVLDGVQLVSSWRRVAKGAGALDASCRCAPEKKNEWSRLEVGPGVLDLLSRLESPARLDEVCARSALPDFEACRFLWAFRVLDWIEPAEIPAVAVAAPETTEPPVDTSATVMNLAPLPQHLIQTRIAATAPAPPPPVPRIPEELARTRLHVPAPPKDTGPATNPGELQHRPPYKAPPEIPPPPRSTGEMMEAILEGSSDAPEPSYDRIPSEPPGSASGDAAYASFSIDYASFGFEEPPSASGDDGAVAPFYVDAGEESVPLIEATVVEPIVPEVPGVPVPGATPLPPERDTTAAPVPSVSSGLELFAMSDPFSAPNPSLALASPKGAPAASVRAPKPEDLEVDADGLGHVFGGDEPE